MGNTKVVIITGASNGIGRASAIEFAARGMKVIVGDVDDKGGAETVRIIRENGGTAEFIHMDVSQESSVKNAIAQTMDLYGRIDVMFANAAIELQKYLIDVEEHEWDKVMAVNLKGVFLCSKHVLSHFIAQNSGNIVITASPHALATYEEIGAYAASKGGVVALCRALALENAKYNIRVNCILPGAIDTPMVQREIEASSNPAELKKMLDQVHPLGRMGRPDEVAKCAVFLASDDASFITGTCLAVDGGVMAKL